MKQSTVGDKNEEILQGRTTFYNMMIAEGFIAMTWAAAGVGALQKELCDVDTLSSAATTVVGVVARNMSGNIGDIIAIIGVIVLPVTSGDTALRSLRLMVADAFYSSVYFCK
ncbi:MAG: hypothetical protein IJ661_02185 [Lachnospiraceae bacterium]|nr:hypothetical protein [Lachnospiraceae bacterium]